MAGEVERVGYTPGTLARTRAHTHTYHKMTPFWRGSYGFAVVCLSLFPYVFVFLGRREGERERNR